MNKPLPSITDHWDEFPADLRTPEEILRHEGYPSVEQALLTPEDRVFRRKFWLAAGCALIAFWIMVGQLIWWWVS